jgi:hypothetical protein
VHLVCFLFIVVIADARNHEPVIPNIPFFLGGGGGGANFVSECVHEGLPDHVQSNHRCLCCAAVIPATPGESQ